MKKNLLLLLLFVGLSAGKVLAQDSLHVAPPPITQVILERLDHQLALTDRQKTEVRAVLSERAERFRNIVNKSSGKKPQKADFGQVNEQALAKLQQVLTPDQFAKLKTQREEEQRQKAAFKEVDLYRTVQDLELDF